MTEQDEKTLEQMAAQAVRNHGVDDGSTVDSIDDDVHAEVFGEALMLTSMEPYEAAEISDVLHEAIASTYWTLRDEANS